MNLRTFLYSLCLLEKAGIDTEKSNFISDRLVHVFLLIMPILGSDSLKDFRAFGAFESLLLTVLEGREPLLAGELLPARGAMKLLHVDLGVGEEVRPRPLMCLVVTLVTFKLWRICAGFLVSRGS